MIDALVRKVPWEQLEWFARMSSIASGSMHWLFAYVVLVLVARRTYGSGRPTYWPIFFKKHGDKLSNRFLFEMENSMGEREER